MILWNYSCVTFEFDRCCLEAATPATHTRNFYKSGERDKEKRVTFPFCTHSDHKSSRTCIAAADLKSFLIFPVISSAKKQTSSYSNRNQKEFSRCNAATKSYFLPFLFQSFDRNYAHSIWVKYFVKKTTFMSLFWFDL